MTFEPVDAQVVRAQPIRDPEIDQRVVVKLPRSLEIREFHARWGSRPTAQTVDSHKMYVIDICEVPGSPTRFPRWCLNPVSHPPNGNPIPRVDCKGSDPRTGRATAQIQAPHGATACSRAASAPEQRRPRPSAPAGRQWAAQSTLRSPLSCSIVLVLALPPYRLLAYTVRHARQTAVLESKACRVADAHRGPALADDLPAANRVPYA